MKETLKLIVNELEKSHYDSLYFDTWRAADRSELFYFLNHEFIEAGFNSFEINGSYYAVSFIRGTAGSGGMDIGSPDTIKVYKLHLKTF